MWAAPPLKPSCCPLNTISTARPPLRRRSMAVSNNMKNGQETMGGLGQAVTSALKSNEPQQQLEAGKSSKTYAIPSGADVLKALERVAAQKAKKNEMKKKKKKRESQSRADSKKDENQGAPCNFDNIRPLYIKSEWADRLEELERRLQQLAHTYQ